MSPAVTVKYAVGDKVFYASAHLEETPEPCPDCLGQKTWQVTTPAAEVFDVPCETCMAGYASTGLKGRWQYTPHVSHLTIGSVRFDSTAHPPATYMCAETGVGSGNVYGEDVLFINNQEALKAAVRLATIAEKNRAEQEAGRAAKARKKSHRKPSWEDRRIKELEASLAKARANPEAAPVEAGGGA